MKRILKLISIVASVIMITALVACGHEPVNVEDTGELISGKYVWTLGDGSSSYTFDTEEKLVVNEYLDNRIEYSYVIAIENDEKIIRLTNLENGKVSEYLFYYGDGYVEISSERYELVEE